MDLSPWGLVGVIDDAEKGEDPMEGQEDQWVPDHHVADCVEHLDPAREQHIDSIGRPMSAVAAAHRKDGLEEKSLFGLRARWLIPKEGGVAKKEQCCPIRPPQFRTS